VYPGTLRAPQRGRHRLKNGRYTEAALLNGEDVFETTAPFPVRVLSRLTAGGGADWRKRIGGR